jgi:hypothetical protein
LSEQRRTAPAGDLGRAIPLFETTLTDSVRVLGPDHAKSRVIRSNLDEVRSAEAAASGH